MKIISPTNFNSLKKGEVYKFVSFETEERLAEDGQMKTYIVPKEPREGKLISVSTRWRENKNKEGKVISKELVGDMLEFEPNQNKRVWEPTGQELTVYKVVVCCGLFQVCK